MGEVCLERWDHKPTEEQWGLQSVTSTGQQPCLDRQRAKLRHPAIMQESTSTKQGSDVYSQF